MDAHGGGGGGGTVVALDEKAVGRSRGGGGRVPVCHHGRGVGAAVSGRGVSCRQLWLGKQPRMPPSAPAASVLAREVASRCGGARWWAGPVGKGGDRAGKQGALGCFPTCESTHSWGRGRPCERGSQDQRSATPEWGVRCPVYFLLTLQHPVDLAPALRLYSL